MGSGASSAIPLDGARRHGSFLEASEDDVCGFVETHIDSRRILEHEGLKFKGRTSFWTPAIRPDDAPLASAWSNSGGAMLATKTSLAASTIGAARGSDGIDSDMGIGDGWLAILLNTSRVALIVVYMEHGVGLKGANLARLYEALSFAKAAKHWPVLVGDWNFEPSELRDFIGLSDNKLAIVPTG